MQRNQFLKNIGLLSAMAWLSPKAFAAAKPTRIQFLRHATLVLEMNGKRFLIDPMLSAKDAMDPVKITRNTSRIPMTSLPIDEAAIKKLVAQVDAVVITHTHRDHWDEAARQLLDKDTTIICQPSDEQTIRAQGFQQVLPVASFLNYKGITIHRTGGQHGTGDIGQRMGVVSGFVFEGEKRCYVAGDTIWCAEVEQALREHQPNVIVLNAGAAQFDQGDPITMTADDVTKVCHALPKSQVVAVHMDTVNHCALTRNDLRQQLKTQRLNTQCLVPNDGELLRV